MSIRQGKTCRIVFAKKRELRDITHAVRSYVTRCVDLNERINEKRKLRSKDVIVSRRYTAVRFIANPKSKYEGHYFFLFFPNTPIKTHLYFLPVSNYANALCRFPIIVKKWEKACVSRLRATISLYGYLKRFCKIFICLLAKCSMHYKFTILSVVKMLEVKHFFWESFKTLIRFKLITFWDKSIF